MSAEPQGPTDAPSAPAKKPWYRALASRYLNVLPLRDLALRARRLHLAAFWTLWEHLEVRRLRREVTPLPTATVAIVVPTFRRPALLRQAVVSALAQTYRDFVVMVVDDGGGQVLGLPEDPRLRVVRLRRNTGVLSVVNNIGIRLTRSRYISLLNDDNRWRPHHLEKAVEALEGGADLVYTGMRRHRADGSDVDVLAVPFNRQTLRRTSYTDSNSLVVRRGDGVHFNRTPRSKKDTVKEDWEFVWRCSRKMRVQFVPDITVDYLIHDDSYLTDWTYFWRQRAASGGKR
ncbi:glycosyltransferase family 2 protein [Geodermatophilus sp. SYSU D00691]